MNPRICKIAQDTDAWCDKYYFGDDLYDLEWEQKFAELIVQECVGVADDYVKDCACDEHIKCKHPRSAIGRKIREHFGGEE